MHCDGANAEISMLEFLGRASKTYSSKEIFQWHTDEQSVDVFENSTVSEPCNVIFIV